MSTQSYIPPIALPAMVSAPINPAQNTNNVGVLAPEAPNRIDQGWAINLNQLEYTGAPDRVEVNAYLENQADAPIDPALPRRVPALILERANDENPAFDQIARGSTYLRNFNGADRGVANVTHVDESPGTNPKYRLNAEPLGPAGVVLGTVGNISLQAGSVLLQGGVGPNTGITVLRASPLATTLAVNGGSNAVTPVINFAGPTENTIAGATIAGNLINLPTGMFDITFVANSGSTNQRLAHAVDLYVDGAFYSRTEPSDYKRVQESHNEASTTFIDLVRLNTAGNINFQMVQTGGGDGGTNNLLTTSRVLIKKL